MDKPISPVIKWAGGKRRLASEIAKCILRNADNNGTYFEPFLGGGALMLFMCPNKCVGIDENPELINFYDVLKEEPEKLFSVLQNYFVPRHSESFYYEIRSWDRSPTYLHDRDRIERAARFVYLNKTCFNGIWRVNSQGYNNVPWNHSDKFPLPKKERFEALHAYFSKHVKFMHGDYSTVVELAKPGDFVYFDPPYDVEPKQSEFTSYTKNGFGRKDQIKLKEICDNLIEKGAGVAVSNSDTLFINNLYSNKKDYCVYELVKEINLTVHRNIGAKINSRKEVTELLIVGKKRIK